MKLRAAGLTLIELMIALSISALTILGAGHLYAHVASTYRAARAEQSVADAAQLAVAAIQADIERVRAADRSDQIAVDVQRVRNDCGSQWTTALSQPIEVGNNRYDFDCPAYARSPAARSDTLTLRSVAAQTTRQPESGRIYVQPLMHGGLRLFTAADQMTFTQGSLTLPRALETRAWYVSDTSAASTSELRIPSLRIKRLAVRNARPTIVDDEIQAGVEDLQVEFSNPPDEPIRVMRVWLLVRSAVREPGISVQIPAYADRGAQSFADGFRRKLVSATIAITDDRPL